MILGPLGCLETPDTKIHINYDLGTRAREQAVELVGLSDYRHHAEVCLSHMIQLVCQEHGSRIFVLLQACAVHQHFWYTTRTGPSYDAKVIPSVWAARPQWTWLPTLRAGFFSYSRGTGACHSESPAAQHMNELGPNRFTYNGLWGLLSS